MNKLKANIKRPRVRSGTKPVSSADYNRMKAEWERREITSTFYESAEEAIAALQGASNLSVGELRSFVDHPDERVVLELLKVRPWSEHSYGYLRAALAYRAMALASQGEDWNPILDRCTRNWVNTEELIEWPSFENFEGFCGIEGFSYENMPSQNVYVEGLAKIRYYLAGTNDEELKRELLFFSNPDLQALVARAPGTLSIPAARTAFERAGNLSTFWGALKPENISTDVVNALNEWVYDYAVELSSREVAFLSKSDRKTPVMRFLTRRQGAATKTLTQKLIALLPNTEAFTDNHEASSPDTVTARELLVDLLMSANQSLDNTELHKIFPYLEDNVDNQIAFAKAAMADEELLVNLWKQAAAEPVQEHIAQRLTTIKSEKLTAMVAESQSIYMKELLLHFGIGDAFIRTLQQELEGGTLVQDVLRESLEDLRTGELLDLSLPTRIQSKMPQERMAALYDLSRHEWDRNKNYNGWTEALIWEDAGGALVLTRLLQGDLPKTEEYISVLLNSPSRELRLWTLNWIGERKRKSVSTRGR